MRRFKMAKSVIVNTIKTNYLSVICTHSFYAFILKKAIRSITILLVVMIVY